jgi:hypothetical protein
VDTLSAMFWLLVPAAFHQLIFYAIHGLAHPGIRASRRLITSCFVWPYLASQVTAWRRDCQQCQQAKVTTNPAAPPLHITNPAQRFGHLHLDLEGPLPPLLSTSADSCPATLIGGCLARFGVPKQITSDRSWQFCSSLWEALTDCLGVKMCFTTPYHPQSNGAVERFQPTSSNHSERGWPARVVVSTFLGYFWG